MCKKLKSRGHSLTIANRGITGRVKEDEKIQYIRCDRADKNAFKTLKEKEFDACVDTSGYNREDVKNSSKDIKTESYIFISTTFVYKKSEQDINKYSKTRTDDKNKYVKNKIDAERVLTEQRGKENILVVRPSVLTGIGITQKLVLRLRWQKELWPKINEENKKINIIDIRHIDNL